MGFYSAKPIHRKDLPTNNTELLKWATEAFGGVTSFTTLHNPMNIIFTGREGKANVTQCLLFKITEICYGSFQDY